MVSEKKILKGFPIISLWKLLITGEGPVWTPCGSIGRTYVGDHKKLLHTIYKSCGSHDLRRFIISHHGNQSSNLISLSPYLMKLYMKFDQNWPIDFCLKAWTDDDGCRTIAIVIPHLSLWLSELKMIPCLQ